MRLPVRLTEDERNNFLLFLYGRLENLKGFASVPRISSLKMGEEGKKRTLSFVYDGRDSSVGTTWTTNVISVTRDEEGTYGAVLESRGAKDACATTGTFIRKMTIAWSVQERKQPGD
jgi:hypothetical protein